MSETENMSTNEKTEKSIMIIHQPDHFLDGGRVVYVGEYDPLKILFELVVDDDYTLDEVGELECWMVRTSEDLSGWVGRSIREDKIEEKFEDLEPEDAGTIGPECVPFDGPSDPL